MTLKLVSFDLCPYVQRASIALAEKNVAFERINIDLADKPDWFRQISPLGKVPLLMVGNEVLFESSVIVEYLDETMEPRLHPADPLAKARHRAWMEFGSSILANIWTIETAHDEAAFEQAVAQVGEKFARLEGVLDEGQFFAGEAFSLVDAVFAPVFRYFDGFERRIDLGVFAGKPKLVAWRKALAVRKSVKEAVVPDYAERLLVFVANQGGVLAARIEARQAA